VSFLLSIFLLTGGTDLATLDAKREEIRPLLNALAIVESNNSDAAVGDNGRAIGRYQIWEIYWRDAVAFAPYLKGEYQDVRSKDYAERIITAYLLRYARDAVECKDFERLARIHNGGPKGYKKKATLKYWNRVEENIRGPATDPILWDLLRILEAPKIALMDRNSRGGRLGPGTGTYVRHQTVT
jgi:hypothetical protein